MYVSDALRGRWNRRVLREVIVLGLPYQFLRFWPVFENDAHVKSAGVIDSWLYPCKLFPLFSFCFHCLFTSAALPSFEGDRTW